MLVFTLEPQSYSKVFLKIHFVIFTGDGGSLSVQDDLHLSVEKIFNFPFPWSLFLKCPRLHTISPPLSGLFTSSHPSSPLQVYKDSFIFFSIPTLTNTSKYASTLCFLSLLVCFPSLFSSSSLVFTHLDLPICLKQATDCLNLLKWLKNDSVTWEKVAHV